MQDIISQFEGVEVAKLTHIKEISSYCRNYYHTEKKQLLFGKSDDDNFTEWFLINPCIKNICIGGSYISDEPEVIRTDECYR